MGQIQRHGSPLLLSSIFKGKRQMFCRQLAVSLWLCLHLQEEKKQYCNRAYWIWNKLSINKCAMYALFRHFQPGSTSWINLPVDHQSKSSFFYHILFYLEQIPQWWWLWIQLIIKLPKIPFPLDIKELRIWTRCCSGNWRYLRLPSILLLYYSEMNYCIVYMF